MNIVFLVYGLTSGGAERTVSYLSEYFSRTNNVTICSFSNDIFYDVSPKVNLIKFGISNKATNIFSRIINARKRKKCIREYLKNNNVDIFFMIIPEKITKYIIKNKKKYNYAVISSERANPKFRSIRSQKIINNIFMGCDGIVFQTQDVKENYNKLIINKSIVIPNAIGNSLAYKLDYNINNRKKIFSAIGRLNDQKDYFTMIDAFSIVHSKYSEYRLEIYGEGHLKGSLLDYIKEKGLKKWVEIFDPSLDALEKISTSTGYLLTSKFEGMPNALIEALAVGIPCISTDCPYGPKDLIESGENGFLVNVGDYKKISNYMIELIENKDYAEKISTNAKKIRSVQNIDYISQKYLDYILDVYNSKNKRRYGL